MKSLIIRGITLLVLLAAVFYAFFALTAGAAHADYTMGCERVNWGFLGSGYRTICDEPKARDGSWIRHRRQWTPAHWVSGYCGTYYCSAGYPVGESTQDLESYPVTPDTIVPGEPDWLPAGSVLIH